VFAVEVNEHRRAVAAQMGADVVLNPATDNVVERIKDETNGTGVDVLLEMSGVATAIRTGFAALRTGGRASLLGIPSKPFELDFARDIIFKCWGSTGGRCLRLGSRWRRCWRRGS
jgi:threonine 3-dehydrogenase